MAARSRILVWEIRAEGAGGLQSMGPTESDTTEQLILSLSTVSEEMGTQMNSGFTK